MHGYYQKYLRIIGDCDYSICTGDLAFDFSFLDKVDSNKHKFFGGNHCNYDKICNYPHNIGNYGEYEINKVKFFFIRGASSIDKAYRLEYEAKKHVKIWWEQEELQYVEMVNALDWYIQNKPDLMLTHDCPSTISKRIGNPNILRSYGFNPETYTNPTQQLLEQCFKYHQPKLWIFGHYHIHSDVTVNNTRFICQPEFGYADINSKLEIV